MSGERTRMSIDEIEAAVLELPEEDRKELIARLQAARSVDCDVDETWRAEVRRRIERIRTGEAEWFDLEEVLAEADDEP